MLLGIDVGGTHTDAVLLDKGGVVASCKVRTDHDNLIESIHASLETVLEGVGSESVRRLNLSTTLTTNAIVEGKTEEVGVIVSAGPGIDPAHYQIGSCYHVVAGALDHRGAELADLDAKGLKAAIAACERRGVKVFAAASKFSVRNPAHESAMRRALAPHADYLTLGHEISGRLNFPRRVATAYYNSAVWRLYNRFVETVGQSLRDFPQLAQARVNVLKADGGTMPLSQSQRFPVQSILSGPAASVMGIVALCDITEDAVILDVGGTTTDIAVFAGGAPLIDPEGTAIGSYPTLVRALKTRSIGVGGDSALSILGDAVRVGPRRLGPPMADGGRTPTLVDVLNAKGLCSFGDVEASRRGVSDFAASRSFSTDTLCDLALEDALGKIRDAVAELLREINDKPVYTIFELLRGRQVKPRRIHVMGGPAEVMAPLLRRALSLPASAPSHSGVANAIGAALTRSTMAFDLFADTQKGVMSIPSLNVFRGADRTYSLKTAERDASEAMLQSLRQAGADEGEIVPEITEASSFNMVEGNMLVGRNIRVRCQAQPGIVEEYAKGVRKAC